METDIVHKVLYARQPIVGPGLELAGFELLFRDGATCNAAPARFDGDLATSRVLINAFTESDIDAVCRQTPAYVNFTANTLLADIPFAPDQLVVEVLESVAPTPVVIKAIARLRDKGYRVALDDYARTDAAHPLIPHIDIVKLEYPRFSRRTLRATVAALKRANPDICVLAEKIETRQDFDLCRAAGCDLFQGYFFARPHPVLGIPGPIRSSGVRRLLDVLGKPRTKLDDVLDIIQKDPDQCRRVRRIAREPSSRGRSLKATIQALGHRRLRGLAMLLALCKPEDKPYALRKLSTADHLQWPMHYRLLSRSQRQAFIGRAVFVPEPSFGPTPHRRATGNATLLSCLPHPGRRTTIDQFRRA